MKDSNKLALRRSLAFKCFKIIFLTYLIFNIVITCTQIANDIYSAKNEIIKNIEESTGVA